MRNEIAPVSGQVRFSQECWEDCTWEDIPETYRYRDFIVTSHETTTETVNQRVIVTEPR